MERTTGVTIYGVKPDQHTTTQIALLNPYKGAIVYNTTTDLNQYFDGTVWVNINENAPIATGWAQYADTQYPTGSPLSIVANTDTILPNNGLSIIDSQKPSDVTNFFDSGKITGRNGDGIAITIDLLVTPTGASATFMEVWLDITGGTGSPTNFANLYRRAFYFPLGVGVSRYVSFTVSSYTLGTWETNGAIAMIRSDAALDVSDVRFLITRTHKAI